MEQYIVFLFYMCIFILFVDNFKKKLKVESLQNIAIGYYYRFLY